LLTSLLLMPPSFKD
jgi:hypothetical protein